MYGHGQPQFQQPVYNGYAQGSPPNNQYYPPPPTMSYPPQQAQSNTEFLQPVSAFHHHQQQQLVHQPQRQSQGENASYYDPESQMTQYNQAMQPNMQSPGAQGYLNPQDSRLDPPYRRRTSSQVSAHSQHSNHSHHSHHSHNSHRSRSSHRSSPSKRSRSPIPERATLGDTLMLIWEAFRGAFDRRGI